MRRLFHSSAIAVVLGSVALVANAQDNNARDLANAGVCDRDWVLVDTDSDGFVSRDETIGALRQEFGQIDLDGNGQITKTEYVDCKAKIRNLQSAEADRNEESFASVDRDKNQMIGRSEFGQAASEAYVASRNSSSPDAEPMIVLRRFVWVTPEEANSELMQAMSVDEAAARSALTFDRLDANNDGTLDASEWRQASTPLREPQESVEADFGKADADGSGTVSQDEYAGYRYAGPDAGTTGSVSDGTGNTNGEEPVVVPDVTAKQDDQARAGVPAFVYRLDDP